MRLSRILLEGRKEDFLNKYAKKFNSDELKQIYLISRELSSNHKYLMFLGNAINPGNVDNSIPEIKNTIKDFVKYQQVLPEKDIKHYQTIEQLKSEIEQHENKNRREVREIDGADIVFENDRYVVVYPKTHEASCFYGSGTKWCTAAMEGQSHFRRYNTGKKLFYVIDKKRKTQDEYYKVAVIHEFNGNIDFYDAKDDSFTKGWILETKQWDEILQHIWQYITDQFSEELEIFADEQRKKEYLEKQRREEIERERREKLQRTEERRQEDEWNIENDNDESNRANAVFQHLLENGVVEEDENEDIYYLDLSDDTYYPGVMLFEWLGQTNYESSYLVGEYDDVYAAAEEYLRNLIDELGISAFNKSFYEQFIDEDAVVDYILPSYEDGIRDSPTSYIDESELPLSDAQEELINDLTEEMNILIEKRDRYGDDEELFDSVTERIEEIESEIDEIRESPEGEISDDQVNEILKSIEDDIRYDPMDKIKEFGIENIDQFVDIDRLISAAIDADGIEHNLASYDGSENTQEVNGETYYIYRRE